MTTKSTLLFPPPQLASCISLAIVRDTRASNLADLDRLNYFPASPLMALTAVRRGRLRVALDLCDLATLRITQPLPRLFVIPPQPRPTQSWSDGPIHAITVGFYPEAWAQLGGATNADALPASLRQPASLLLQSDDISHAWTGFCAALEPIWTKRRSTSRDMNWTGSHRIADWVRYLVTHAALSGAGRSARTLERRLKRWTGQSKLSLRAYAQLEDLHSLYLKEPDTPLAALAADACFSDQSHMGRAVKKATGFSPARLNRQIETSEAFWCYRLLGAR